jgi:hypothetical protein
MREERRLRVFENGLLRKKLEPKTDEVKDNGGNYTIRSFMICTITQYCTGDKIENNETGGACSTYG